MPPNPQGWLWCESLGLWMGTWQGQVDREPPRDSCHWLRFYTSAGELVPLPEEIGQQQLTDAQQQLTNTQQQLEQERQQHEALIAKLRQQGIDPDRL